MDHTPAPDEQLPETTSPQPLRVDANPQGCLGYLGWFGAAFVLPIFSPTFYSRAVRSRLFTAMAFFFLFALAVSAVQTTSVVHSLLQVRGELQTAYANQEFPIIVIQAGEARVEGQQPYVLIDDGTTLVVIDTTGVYQDIDDTRYVQGLLLTRRSLIYLTSTGEYQKMPLSQLQVSLNMDPIILDAESVLSVWTILGVFVSLTALFGLLLWNTFGRLVTMIMLALLFWGLTLLAKKQTSFAEVLAPGLYAVVPAVYFSTILGRTGFGFIGLFTVLMGLFWMAGLTAALYPYRANPAPSTLSEYLQSERPLRASRAWIGLPLLLFLAYETIFGWQPWYISWSLTVLTLLNLAAASLYPVMNLRKAAAAEAGSLT
jgi:hypothetical protein